MQSFVLSSTCLTCSDTVYGESAHKWVHELMMWTSLTDQRQAVQFLVSLQQIPLQHADVYGV